MKKIFAMLLAVVMLFGLTSCGDNNTADGAGNTGTPQSSSAPESGGASDETPPSELPEASGSSEYAEMSSAGGDTHSTDKVPDRANILIAYFSRAGENYNVGVIEKGNTEIVAEMIAEQTGGELFRIETVIPYPEDYSACTDVAQQEQRDNARPELTAAVDDFDSYDVVFIGYPIWWGDMPMAVYTFLESYDFTGKTIVPFATHEGSGLSSTESSIAGICSGAEVLEGLAIRGSIAQNSQEEAKDDVVSWLREAGVID